MTMQFLFYYIRFHKRAPQVLIVSRNIQPRVEIRENPTKGMRSIMVTWSFLPFRMSGKYYNK